MIKIIITRWPPILSGAIPNLVFMTELAPSATILKEYKVTNDWNVFAVKFYEEMNLNMTGILQTLARASKTYDICLLCYEKDYKHCHRTLLAQWFIDNGFSCSEIQEVTDENTTTIYRGSAGRH
jgi:uncharacterized protein YeaO (DUF488 family)